MTDDICRNNHGGNEESEAANERIHECKPILRAQIYAFFLSKGEGGAISEEVYTGLPQINHNSVSGRISELKRDGRLVRIGTRKAKSGCSAAVLVASELLPTEAA